MKKISSLFKRNYEGDHLVRDEIVPGSEWVIQGEGIATRKYDGTCCMVLGGELYSRHDVRKKTPPEAFIPAQEPDPITGHWPGWLKCNREDPKWKYHFEAFDEFQKFLIRTGAGRTIPLDGTYELCGPKVNSNPEKCNYHILISHEYAEEFPDCPRTFEALREWLVDKDIEGVVWHHPDGRMVKIKKRDFGLKR